MAEPIISVEGVGVRFSRTRRRHRSLRDMLLKGQGVAKQDNGFWAFENVSFDISQGESVGVVGRNGAGKSTLLSLLAGVLLPDSGKITVRAGVAPLIAITGGFENELTVRENIHLVSGLHGMNKEQIEDVFGDIVSFAEIGRYLDTPFKHLSSGWKVRVAFSVVSRLREPILLVDEVLAVGDKAFRVKCFERIDELLSEGQTLFLVSHAEGNLRRFCTRGLFLDKGRLAGDGPIEDVIEQYDEAYGTANISVDGFESNEVFDTSASID